MSGNASVQPCRGNGDVWWGKLGGYLGVCYIEQAHILDYVCRELYTHRSRDFLIIGTQMQGT